MLYNGSMRGPYLVKGRKYVREIRFLYQTGHSLAHIAKLYDMPRSTVYYYVKGLTRDLAH